MESPAITLDPAALLALAALVTSISSRYFQSNGAAIFLSGQDLQSGSVYHVLFSKILSNVLSAPMLPHGYFRAN